MKSLLIVFILLASADSMAADKKKQVKSEDKKILVPQEELKKDTGGAPCQLTQEQLLKQLDEKKKAQDASGKALGLQGLGSPGCSVK